MLVWAPKWAQRRSTIRLDAVLLMFCPRNFGGYLLGSPARQVVQFLNVLVVGCSTHLAGVTNFTIEPEFGCGRMMPDDDLSVYGINEQIAGYRP